MSTDMERIAGTSQATRIEQTRAVAEVEAAVLVAQRCPRDDERSIAKMKESCGRKSLAERAFYSYPRAGEQVTGASVYLARELARVWGNVQYGLKELSRDDVGGESEMLVFAWDLESNTWSTSTFIVPHARDTKTKGRVQLTDLRDIYENNANMGARRLREAIFSVLPPWFVEEAKQRCWSAIENGDQRPIALRVAAAIEAFGNLGVTQGQIETRLGRKSRTWTAHDLAQLGVLLQSLKRGETSIDEAFPEAVVTAAEITAAAQPAKPAETAVAEPTPPAQSEPPKEAQKASQRQPRRAADPKPAVGSFTEGTRPEKIEDVDALAGLEVEEPPATGWDDVEVVKPGEGKTPQ